MLWVVISLAIGYAILTGGRPPVTRATTLVVVMCGARLCGRPLFAGNTIAFAAIILLVRNPACLFDPGTQLSFVAVLALMQGIGSPRDRPAADPLEQLLQPIPSLVAACIGSLLGTSVSIGVAQLC